MIDSATLELIRAAATAPAATPLIARLQSMLLELLPLHEQAQSASAGATTSDDSAYEPSREEINAFRDAGKFLVGSAGNDADGTAAEPHPAFTPHPMQGWVPNFLPKIAGDAVDAKHYDRVVRIADADALRASRTLARTEGILVGITAGATLAGALAVAKDAPKGSTILAMLPDTGERYLSTPLFADIAVDIKGVPVKIRSPGCNR